jgi:RNA polymerase sigma factor (sigma-70 family)
MTHPEKSTNSALQKALQHDRAALEELLLLRYDWLRDVAYKTIPVSLREKICVEDVLQESFVRILRGFANFSPQGGEASLFHWLKTIIQNTAKDALRSNLRSRVAFAADNDANRQVDDSVYDFITSLAVADDPRASVVARGQELTQAFRVAVANLDPKYQQVIQQLYIDQISIEQVAVNLETTEAAVRGLRQRAREKIREAMVRLSHFV